MADPKTREELIARRAALRAREDELDARPRDPDAPAMRSDAADEASIEAEGVLATRDYVRTNKFPDASVDALIEAERGPRYPVEDGPGSGRYVDVTVRLMVGTRRSTVVITRGRDERALLNEVREHGAEADGIGEAVETALRDGLKSLT